MNVLVFASRKGGSGKSTLTAHLAAHAAKSNSPTLLIDADPQGSLTLWHQIRGEENPSIKKGVRGIAEAVKAAKREGYEWVFIDTPPTKSSAIVEAIGSATMVVIPSRPSVFDLAAVQDTIAISREQRKPYAVILNAAPAKRNDAESAVVADARGALSQLRVPVWSGQITNRAELSLALAYGEASNEFDAESAAAEEISNLWKAIERSVKAINGAYKNSRGGRAAA
ncbi:AAA family ATPase [Microvirga flavescens]|uniref:AAA family ATPase n=1 Tax=Microvirga flavescens TaxID=2249811 RepID=UPI000DD7595B|nr:AAA family ATPase [Microvirga flavescens]